MNKIVIKSALTFILSCVEMFYWLWPGVGTCWSLKYLLLTTQVCLVRVTGGPVLITLKTSDTETRSQHQTVTSGPTSRYLGLRSRDDWECSEWSLVTAPLLLVIISGGKSVSRLPLQLMHTPVSLLSFSVYNDNLMSSSDQDYSTHDITWYNSSFLSSLFLNLW